MCMMRNRQRVSPLLPLASDPPLLPEYGTFTHIGANVV